MASVNHYREELAHLTPDALVDYLSEHSGLPGPRGNLELADAFTALAPTSLIHRLATSDDEYLRFCGTQSLGRLLVEDSARHEVLDILRERAQDSLWRVREAASRALQIVGDHNPDLLRDIVEEWTAAPEPFVSRAAVAAVCEPRLLRDAATQSAAFVACQRATDWIASLDDADRKRPDVRNLRQALGYCWSVAIAANPATGLAWFETLQKSGDPDIAWIVSSNVKKARLRRLLP